MPFSQISVLLVVAAFLGILVKKLKQPVLIGYLFAGFLLALTGIFKDHEAIQNLGKVGVALLLFLVGLEMNIRELPTIGKAALYTGLGQIAFTFTVALLLGLSLGYSLIISSYLAIAVSFSSTIIIVKLLSEKNALGSLYGKISVGFLLVQDLVAILILLFLSGIREGGLNGQEFLFMGIKALIMLGSIWFLSKKILPLLFEKFVADSQELLFIVSIAWALGIASLVAGPLGFTLEIGGFLAGLALSNLPEHLEIAARTRPLRDFFLTIFFLSLGANLVVDGVQDVLLPASIYSLLVLVGNPIIVMIVMGFLRFKKRTSFLASVTVAQISEFSLVVVAMGYSLGHLDEKVVALTVMVAAVTMTISTYLILNAEKIYTKISDLLSIFERRLTSEVTVSKEKDFKDHVVLIGCYRTGSYILPFIKKKSDYLIVDFNPKVHKRLTAENHPVIFGDITDPEILAKLNLNKAKLIISTIDKLADNLVLLEHIGNLRKRPTSIFTTVTRSAAIKLYENGASYVIVPDIVAGEHLRHMLKSHGFGGKKLKKIGKSHFDKLLFI
jgi:Kef-type K+ transport system membrane component KefB